MSSIIEARAVVKHYGDVVAVDNLNLKVEESICLGLLGPNGAGKTTTIEMMEGILKPTGGEILFRGRKLDHSYRSRLGIQFQSTALQEFITVRETLKLFSAFYDETRPIEEIIDICSLNDIIDRDNRKLSGGQRQRMLLGLALVNNPEIIFLDEPTTGLDPQARRNFWRLIENIKAEQRTIVLTTHYMDEAEKLCDSIAIIDQGKIIAFDSPRQLLDKYFAGVIVRLPLEEGVRLPLEARYHQGYADIQTRSVQEVIKKLNKADVSLDGLSIHVPNLDDLFLKLTGGSLRN